MIDVIVIGAGHAGCEAALAAARLGCRTLLLTLDLDRIAWMSCNPAVGGTAKGQLVREIDALGGEMARNTDRAGIQTRILNASKGPAVQATRVQCDRRRYAMAMRTALEATPGLRIAQRMVERLVVEAGRVVGVETSLGERLAARAVVVTTGTFLRGLVHIGSHRHAAGRVGEPAAEGLSRSLEELGFRLTRLKTGTTPRLDRGTIDVAGLEPQPGIVPPPAFSYDGVPSPIAQIGCWLTATNERTHAVIRENLDRSPLFGGTIVGTGPRYCPSIEDKVVRFPDRTRHLVFLEPEGLDVPEIYPNGLSTSLPVDVQLAFLRTIAGLERVEIARPGYAIEYDAIDARELDASLEARRLPGLFFAGQVNGTSGYEEAAGQGLLAGLNAALAVRGDAPVILDRGTSYLGVMVDDLTTRGTEEPYRLFTSRAEHRLLLREDNADERLAPLGRRLGLVDDARWGRYVAKREAVARTRAVLEAVEVRPTRELLGRLAELGLGPLRVPATLADLLRRPGATLRAVATLAPTSFAFEELTPDVVRAVEVETCFEGYLARERAEVERMRRLERVALPEDLDYGALGGLSREVQEKLTAVRPRTLGQAGRIPGVTPAAVTRLGLFVTVAVASRPGPPEDSVDPVASAPPAIGLTPYEPRDSS